MKIKTGDLVRVTAGKDKGKEGKVMQVFPGREKVVVDGVRSATRHMKPGRGAVKGTKGQKVSYFAPIAVSNVALVVNGSVGRVGVVRKGDERVRVIRKAKKVYDVA